MTTNDVNHTDRAAAMMFDGSTFRGQFIRKQVDNELVKLPDRPERYLKPVLPRVLQLDRFMGTQVLIRITDLTSRFPWNPVIKPALFLRRIRSRYVLSLLQLIGDQYVPEADEIVS
jgi:hypothetical protein